MERLVLAAVRRRVIDEGRPLDAATEAALREDPRPSAAALLREVKRRRSARRSEGQRLRHMLGYETALWSAGVERVAGVDEAGMSPLAGPVAAGAVVFRKGFRMPEIDDSKKLDAKTRERLAVAIQREALASAVGFAEVDEIDSLNIYWAGLLAMRRAVDGLGLVPEHILLDARRLHDVPIPQQRIVRGDATSLTIAAASILAKTARDRRMQELDALHPGYGFAKHKGYPVREHVEALTRLGATPVHRRSFGPVRKALGLPPLPPWPKVQNGVRVLDEGAGDEALLDEDAAGRAP